MRTTTTIRKKRKRNRIIVSIIVILLIIAIGTTINILNKRTVVEVINKEETDYHTVIYNDKKMIYNTSIVSLLFMGIDTVDSNEAQGQADVIQLVLLDRENKKIEIIPFSRDTMAEIKMFDVSRNDLGWHEQHLNLAYAYGDTKATGCMLTAQAISRLLNGIPIAYYGAMDLSMISNIQNIVGNLEVTIPNDSLEKVNSEWIEGSKITITKDNVEAYLRTRSIEEDFSNNKRMERQKVYLDAYFKKLKEMLENDTEGTVKTLYNICKDMTTNISLSDIQTFAQMMMSYDFDIDTNYHHLEGENVLGANHDEFHLDKTYFRELILKLFYRMEEQ